MMQQRANQILKEIIDFYTQTGQPVGSKTLVQHLGLELSSATIRNVMADLEDMGFLASPHTSAGRVPTEAGYRYYAKGLIEVRDLETGLKRALNDTIAQAPDFNAALKSASSLIADMTGCAGLVLAPKVENESLAAIEFIRLSAGRVLVVLVSESGNVENRMIQIPEDITADDLSRASRQLNQVVRGLTIPEALTRVVAALREHKAALDNMLERVISAPFENAVMVSGSQHLLGSPDVLREHLGALARMFEEKRLLLGLLSEVKNSSGVQVFVGADCPLEVAKDCAMVTASYGTTDQRVLGTVGVIGPMRMNYEQAVAVVDYTAKVLSKTLQQQLKYDAR